MVFQIIAIVYHQLRCMPLEEKKNRKTLVYELFNPLKICSLSIKKGH